MFVVKAQEPKSELLDFLGVLSKAVDLLRFVPVVDVALCLLIMLEIIKKNKEKALGFPPTGTSTSLFPIGKKPLHVGWEC